MIVPIPTPAFGMPQGGELIIILVIILLLFGAKRLPELARSLGQAKKEFSKAAKETTEEIEKIKETPMSTASPQSSSPNNDSSKKA